MITGDKTSFLYGMDICWFFNQGPAPWIPGKFPQPRLYPDVEMVEVYAWHRLSWQFSGLNQTHCYVDIMGSNDSTCWGKLFTMKWMGENSDQFHDPVVNGDLYPRTKYVMPIVYGDPHPLNNLAVILFCSKQFAPGP